MIKITKDFRTVATSKNLAGILRYASRHGVSQVSAMEMYEGRGSLCIIFLDNAIVTTEFESFRFLLHWLKARRGWPAADTLPAPKAS